MNYADWTLFGSREPGVGSQNDIQTRINDV
jgi:hypothetical protein